jgi:hypothetical protein
MEYHLTSWSELDDMDSFVKKLEHLNKEDWGIIKILPPSENLHNWDFLSSCPISEQEFREETYEKKAEGLFIQNKKYKKITNKTMDSLREKLINKSSFNNHHFEEATFFRFFHK